MKIEILLIEDASADIKLISIALNAVIPNLNLRVARDGETGYLELCAHRPDLLILDLNIPKKNGIELLTLIRSNSSLQTLPVIILTNSTSPKDVEAAYKAYCNAYIRKPVGFEKLMSAIDLINKFWLGLSTIIRSS